MEEVIVLQLTPVEKKDVYLLVSGTRMICFDISMGKVMDLSKRFYLWKFGKFFPLFLRKELQCVENFCIKGEVGQKYFQFTLKIRRDDSWKKIIPV